MRYFLRYSNLREGCAADLVSFYSKYIPQICHSHGIIFCAKVLTNKITGKSNVIRKFPKERILKNGYRAIYWKVHGED